MSADNSTQNAYPSEQHNPDLKNLDRLIGTWNVTGGANGQIAYEWMEGGFFLLQQVDFDHDGHPIKGLEVIGHLRPFGEEESEHIKSRFMTARATRLTTSMNWMGIRSRYGAEKKALPPTIEERSAKTAIR